MEWPIYMLQEQYLPNNQSVNANDYAEIMHDLVTGIRRNTLYEIKKSAITAKHLLRLALFLQECLESKLRIRQVKNNKIESIYSS